MHFFTVLEARNIKIKAPARIRSWGKLVHFQMPTFSLCPPMVERIRLPGVSSYKDTNPAGSGLPLIISFKFNYLYKALSANRVTLWFGISTYEYVGGTFSP